MNKNISADIKAVVTDIEGTISSSFFMRDVLLPYISANISGFIWDYEPDLIEHLNLVRKEENNPDLNTEEVIEVLLRYIDEGEKASSLQPLQTMLLEEGYRDKKIQSQIYEDALRALKRWREQNISVYIYSSFSVPEQRLFCTHTQVGNINSSFDGFFDMDIGDKKNAQSYDKIAASIGIQTSGILFLTDNIEDAVTASNTGMKVIVLDRQACLTSAYGRRIEHDFDNILPETVHA